MFDGACENRDLAALLQMLKEETFDRPIICFSAARSKDDLAGFCSEGLSNNLARFLDRIARAGAERMHARCIAVFTSEIRLHRRAYFGQQLRRSAIVQVDHQLA